jgi:hypothetical protein
MFFGTSFQALRGSGFFFLISCLGVCLCSFYAGRLAPLGLHTYGLIGAYLLTMVFTVTAWLAQGEKFTKLAFSIFILTTFLARFFLFPMEMSDDVNRYLWEGEMQVKGFNPYDIAPQDPRLKSILNQGFQLPNHPEMRAIYPPLAQLFLRWMVKISGTENPRVFKFVLTLLDLLTLGVILLALYQGHRSLRHGILYAFNPVVLYSFAGHAHLDSLMVFFLVLSLWLFSRQSFAWMWAALACSVGSKFLVLFLVPCFLKRSTLRWFPVFPLLLLGLYFPYLGAGMNLFSSLLDFGLLMQYNGSLFPVFKTLLFESFTLTHLILALGAVIFCGWFMLCSDDPYFTGALTATVFLLISPTVHFWYLSLLVPFLCWFAHPALMVWCGLSGLWFVVLEGLYLQGNFDHFPLAVLAQYAPVYFLFYWDWKRKNQIPCPPKNRPLPRVSIIIPALNEEKNLRLLLNDLKALKDAADEVIVIDGGSKDGTLDIARRGGAIVSSSPRGRGLQICQGIEQSRSEVCLILHADIRVEKEIIKDIRICMAGENSLGGCLGNRYESMRGGQWIIHSLNLIRAKFLGMSFGDQGQFFLRKSMQEGNWDLNLPIMEDVELSLCLLNHPSNKFFLFGGLVSSVRRWEKSNRLKNALQIIFLVLSYCLRRKLSGKVDTQALYEKYYGKKKP